MELISTHPLTLSWVFLAVLLVLLHLRSAMKWRARARGRSVPPGPRRFPVIGSMLSVPTWKPWKGFRDMLAKYGDIVYLEVLGAPMVVLGSPELIDEFLEKRSANTSDRIKTPLISLAGQAYNFAFMPYGQWWRDHRRMFWQHFNPGRMSEYWHVERAVTRKFLVKLLEKPTALKRLVQFHVAAITMKVTYGIDIEDHEDELVTIVDESFMGLRLVTATMQFLLQHFPFVQHVPPWFPGASFHQLMARARVPADFMLDVPFNQGREIATTSTNDYSNSVVAQLLGKLEDPQGDAARQEHIARDITSIAVTGGSDTTYSTIMGFFLAISLHPQVMAKAQAELDAVVGPDRLPDFDDRDALVYLNATVKEALRWHNVVPLGVTHCTVNDDELCGYFIPAGTAVVPNVWAIMHNPQYYTDPGAFDPDRFIRNGKLDPEVLDPMKLAFGHGRRICPGRHFADLSLFLTIACVLHVFDIGPPLDGQGHPIKIQYESTHGFLVYPEDCRCTVKPRSARAESLIRGSAESGVL
ncbi:cytochrome P450 [Trametes coccinea BRFM310]|uniref:Cytochrome P450 n=1 Tax=Trametes coccinea (strain BRFM310) TaxID=1353009 RepID=A0A1Y2J5H2_TRAC3|nr:cytochrome P450 [Trametes coccinea BRFM310]